MKPRVRCWTKLRLVLGLFAAGCSTWAYRNEPRVEAPVGKTASPCPGELRATFELDEPSRTNDVVVCLALSGGGSRAAWFSSAVMFQLGKIEADPDLLDQVDVISSVSGGSLTAAYYAISQDQSPRAHLTAAPRSALPACTHAKLEFDPKTSLLTVTGPIAADEAKQLHSACDPADAHRIDRLVLASQGSASGRVWESGTVRELMTRNYVSRCFWNCFWPTNIALYWCTAFDRGDIMAATFADNLFDCDKLGASYGRNLDFADLNPVRPHLILNSTNGTDDPDPEGSGGDLATLQPGYGNVFTFTCEDFDSELKSDLSKFPIADAVMASASFPGAFPYRTLRNFNVAKPSYVHVFDGGNSDNLGLTSIREVIKRHEKARPSDLRKTKYIVICIDSYTEPRGARPSDADPRSAVDYVVDTDFFDAIDMLLKNNRYHVLANFMNQEQQNDLTRRIEKRADEDQKQRKSSQVRSPQQDLALVRHATTRSLDPKREPDSADWEPNDLGKRLLFWHITFSDLYGKDRKLYNEVNSIATDFKIDDEQADQLEDAAKILVKLDANQKIVKDIKDLLAPR